MDTNEEKEKTFRTPNMLEAQTVIWVTVLIIAGGMIMKMRVEFLMLLAAAFVLLFSKRLGYSWSDFEPAISDRVKILTPTILIMWCIGLLIGALIYSGSIPMLIYYGFEVISPQHIYLSAFIVCSIISSITGSSWTAAGTAGVACLALANGLGASTPIVTGAIIAGSVFGDKLSPMSETTNLAPVCADTDIYKHIKSQLWTTVPTWFICFFYYYFLGSSFAATSSGLPETAKIMMEQLDQLYRWNIILVIPFLIVLVGAIKKQPVCPTLLLAGFFCGLLGICYQGFSLSDSATAMIKGFQVSSIAPKGMQISPIAARLLNRGGMMSMASVVLICYCGFSLTTMMIKAGYVKVALQPLLNNFTTRGKTMLTAEIAIFFVHAIAGNSYVSSVFVGEAWRRPFIENYMGKPCLSRTLEDVGTTVSCLFPWGNSGAFYLGALGVIAWGEGGFWPYVVFPFACPIIALILAITGVGISRLTPEEREFELDKLTKAGL